MITRRDILKSGMAATTLMTAPAFAQNRSIKIGVLSDFSGPLSDVTGRGSLAAVEMAVAELGRTIKGRSVEVVFADHQNKADIGVAIARKWFDLENVDAIIDVGNSAIALAVMDLVRERNRVLLATAPMVNDITGPRCTANSIQWNDNYLMARSVTSALLGRGKKTWYFVTADYSFGHDLEKRAGQMIEAGGGKVLGRVRFPAGSSDFSSFLLQAQGSGAEVVAFASAGADTLTCIAQGKEFGLTQGPKPQMFAAFVAPITVIHGLGLERSAGLYVSEPFYWNLDDSTRAFSEAYLAKAKQMPNYSQAAAYSGTKLYLSALDRLGGDATDGRAVVAEMKAKPFEDSLYGDCAVRSDGRVIHRAYLFAVKEPKQSSKPWDYYDLVAKIQGDQAAMPIAQGGCPRAT